MHSKFDSRPNVFGTFGTGTGTCNGTGTGRAMGTHQGPGAGHGARVQQERQRVLFDLLEPFICACCQGNTRTITNRIPNGKTHAGYTNQDRDFGSCWPLWPVIPQKPSASPPGIPPGGTPLGYDRGTPGVSPGVPPRGFPRGIPPGDPPGGSSLGIPQGIPLEDFL